MSAQARKSLPKPSPASLHPWEQYSATLAIEYRQSLEEGLDVERYADLFRAVEALPAEAIDAKEKLADTLYELVMTAPTRAEYAYDEPSDPEGIVPSASPMPWRGKCPRTGYCWISSTALGWGASAAVCWARRWRASGRMS